MTLCAALLGVSGIGQSLFGDELLTYAEVPGHGLTNVVEEVRTATGVYAENSPPLFFVLAWAASKLGDPMVTIRLPSLIFGSLTIPLVYLLGTRTLNRRAGLVGAALMAISPFMAFYLTEARGYAVMAFFVVLSTLALLSALERGRLWWALYVGAAAAALYTHYTCVFVIAAQAAWAAWFHRERLRELVIAHAAVALLYLPWVPYIGGKDLDSFYGSAPPTLGSFGREVLKALAGHPFVGPARLPGTLPLVAIGAALLVGMVSLGAPERGPAMGKMLSPPFALILVLALATPVGLLAYSHLANHDLALARNLIASIPAASLLAGWLLTAPPRPIAAATCAVALGALAVGTAKSLSDDYRRPAMGDVASFVDARGRPDDPVVQTVLTPPSDPRSRDLRIHLSAERPFFVEAAGSEIPWERLPRNRPFFFVRPAFGLFAGNPRLPQDLSRRFRLGAKRTYAGFAEVAVYEFTPP